MLLATPLWVVWLILKRRKSEAMTSFLRTPDISIWIRVLGTWITATAFCLWAFVLSSGLYAKFYTTIVQTDQAPGGFLLPGYVIALAAAFAWTCLRVARPPSNPVVSAAAPVSLVAQPDHPKPSLQSTLILHAGFFTLVAVTFFIGLPRFAEIYREMGVPQSSIPQIRTFGPVTGLLIFPALFVIDVGLCFLVRKFGGRRGLRLWSIAVILVMLSVVTIASVVVWRPMQKLVTGVSGSTKVGNALPPKTAAEHDWQPEASNGADADKNWNPWAGHIKNGDRLRMGGDLAGALKSYQASLDAALEKSHMAQSQTKLGDVQSALGELDAALKSYRDSLAILDALLASESENAAWRTLLFTAFVKIGDVLQAQGNAVEAMKSYRAGVAVFHQRPKGKEWNLACELDGSDYNPAEPFVPAELMRLAASPADGSPSKEMDRQRRMFWLINRASAEKVVQLRALLDNKELMKVPLLELAVAGYDYSMNNNPKVLDFILGKLAAEPVGSDSNASVVLAFIDEWERTVAAVESHFTATDGAGGMNRAAFWEIRQFLFPRRYLQFRQKTIEGAPVKGEATAAVEKQSPPSQSTPDAESWSYTLRHLDAAQLDQRMKAKPVDRVTTKVEAGVVTLTGPREKVRQLATMLRVIDQPEVKDPLQLPILNMPPDFFTRMAIPALMSGMEFKDTQFDPAFFETLKRENITAPQLARALAAHVLELEKATFVNTGTPFESIKKIPGASTYYDGTIPCADQPDKPLTLRIRRTTQQMGTKPDIAGLAPWLIEEAKLQSSLPSTPSR